VGLPAHKNAGPSTDGAVLLRNEPVQARSTARLTALLDAAAAVVDEIGYERLTTAMVSERAGASIGTVYRYFPDRIVVLQGLSARYIREFSERVRAAVAEPKHSTPAEAIAAALDVVVAGFKSEPGFRSLRFGDVLDIEVSPGVRGGMTVIANAVASGVAERFEVKAKDVLFPTEVALGITDGLLARAYAENRKGETRFITEAKTLARSYLASALG
jgi:AcrR family transcriptional regulator